MMDFFPEGMIADFSAAIFSAEARKIMPVDTDICRKTTVPRTTLLSRLPSIF